MTNDLCTLTATALLEGYRKRTLSPVEVTQAVLQRIHDLNPKLNAFNLISDQAIEEAKASESRFTMSGVSDCTSSMSRLRSPGSVKTVSIENGGTGPTR